MTGGEEVFLGCTLDGLSFWIFVVICAAGVMISRIIITAIRIAIVEKAIASGRYNSDHLESRSSNQRALTFYCVGLVMDLTVLFLLLRMRLV